MKRTSVASSVDTVRPEIDYVEFDTTELAIGDTANVNIYFTEPVTNVDISDFNVNYGTLGALANAGEITPTDESGDPITDTDGNPVVYPAGSVWSAVFTPSVDVDVEFESLISLRADGFDIEDLNGNPTVASEVINQDDVSIDTEAPEVVSIDVSPAALNAEAIGTLTVTFSESVLGVSADNFSVSGANISGFRPVADGSSLSVWRADIEPLPGVELSDVTVSFNGGSVSSTVAESDDVVGTIEQGDTFVSFELPSLTAGLEVSVSTILAGENPAYDTELTIVDSNGVLVGSDDDAGYTRDSDGAQFGADTDPENGYYSTVYFYPSGGGDVYSPCQFI